VLTLRRSRLKGQICVFLVCSNDRLTPVIRDFLELEHRIEVVGVANSAKDALERFELVAPDAVVLETGWNFLSGLQSLRLFRERLQSTRVIVLSFLEQDSYRSAFLETGAHDFVSETDILNSLLPAILPSANGNE
jgi:DNA-binding NarL/FixJ family response regulator